MKIDYKLMKNICLANIEDFGVFGEIDNTPSGILIYRQNKRAKILGVAHLDTVLTSNHFKLKKNKTRVYNQQLDDRLGVYTMLDLLPQMGIEFDVLFTEGEETGQSTAQYFETTKDYNWIFSFDRRGDDVVLYNYQDWERENSWEKSLARNFKIGLGSCSDIYFMEDLGIKAVNIGTGYIGEHLKSCYADMNVLSSQVNKFTDFYHKNKDIKYPHTKTQFAGSTYPAQWENGDYEYSRFDSIYGHNKRLMGCYLCEDGLGINKIEEGIYLCDKCFNSAQKCESCNDIFLNTEIFDGLCIACAHGFDDGYPLK